MNTLGLGLTQPDDRRDSKEKHYSREMCILFPTKFLSECYNFE